MCKINSFSSWRYFLCFFSSICLLLIPGLADTPSTSNSTTDKSKKSMTGLEIFILLIGIVAAAVFSFFLYKLWQKKKREEQHAQLLKLFDQDDDLELELGIRD